MACCESRCRGPRSREPRSQHTEHRETGDRETGWREGLLESLAVVLAFVGFGLLWAAVESRAAFETRAPSSNRSYPDTVVAPETRRPSVAPDPSIWLVDGFNVLHACVLHGRDRAEWWSAPRRAELLALAHRFDDASVEIWVVFDGPRAGVPAGPATAGAEPGGVHEVFASSADDWLVDRVRTSPDPSRLAVVTADRRLAGRTRHRGAWVVAPREFLAHCQS